MSGYEILKFLHVLAVIGWIGGGLAVAYLQGRMGAAGDRAGLLSIGRQMEAMGKQYFGPLAVVTLVTGVLMVATTEGLTFGDAWILIGLGGIVASMGLGFGGFQPTGRRLLEESQKPDPDPATLGALSGRLKMFSILNLTVLSLVVLAMVTKVGL